MAKKIRSIVFTLNNYTEADVERIQEIGLDRCRFICYGKEVGESGTPHLQGFCYSDGQRSFKWWKELIGGNPHIEKTKGTAEEAISYCAKDGDFWERGDRPVSGVKRGEDEAKRWEDARDAAKAGKLDDIPADIYVRYYRTVKEIAKDHLQAPPDADGLTGLWICGLAGVGKSRFARETAPGAYLKMVNKWWDGYQGQDDVIIDDVDKGHSCLGHHFKIWADRYSFLAETKGGAVAIRPKRIIVTSQYTIDEIWEDEETRDALHRRFTVNRLL